MASGGIAYADLLENEKRRSCAQRSNGRRNPIRSRNRKPVHGFGREQRPDAGGNNSGAAQMANDNSNVRNLPVVDFRVIEFAAQLEDYIREKGADLSLMSVVGVLECVKHVFLAESLVRNERRAMISVNEEIQDRTIRHMVYLERYKASEIRKILKELNTVILPEIEAKLEKRIERIVERGSDLGRNNGAP